MTVRAEAERQTSRDSKIDGPEEIIPDFRNHGSSNDANARNTFLIVEGDARVAESIVATESVPAWRSATVDDVCGLHVREFVVE